MVSNDLILTQYEETAFKYCKLISPEFANNGVNIRGLIDIIDEDGNYWDTYEVAIYVPNEYPNELPKVYERSNKIIPTCDWHINPDKSCCLSTNAIMYSHMDYEVTLLKWLDLFVVPFFANHIYKIRTGHYAENEFSHGSLGILEGYYKIFNTNSKSEVIQLLNNITGTTAFNHDYQCFCKSGKLYKNCYLINPISHAFGIPIHIIQKDLNELQRSVIIYNMK